MTTLPDATGSEAIDAAAAAVAPLDAAAMEAAQGHLDRLTKPPGSLGRLEEIVRWVAGVSGDAAAGVRPARVVVAAADHGVARRGVSAWPQDVTAAMVGTYLAGGAAINALADWAGADVVVVDAGLLLAVPATGSAATLLEEPIRRGGTDDLAAGPAMSRAEAVAALELGLRIAADLATAGIRAVGVGEMGIGNTTAASAITAVLSGRPAAEVTGVGTGVGAAGLARKVDAVERALRINRADRSDPVSVLAAVGGFEIGTLSGIILGAAAARMPVVLDGFITAAAAALAAGLAPDVPARLIAAHRSTEPGHGVLLDHLGLRPLLELELRLGEGTGAAIGLGLLDAACRVRDEMSTFASAGISARLDD